MSNITRRTFLAVAGAATAFLAGCGSSGSQGKIITTTTTITENSSSASIEASKDDIEIIMAPVLNFFEEYRACTYITKVRNNGQYCIKKVYLQSVAHAQDDSLLGSDLYTPCVNNLQPGEEAYLVGEFIECDTMPASVKLNVQVTQAEEPNDHNKFRPTVKNAQVRFGDHSTRAVAEVVNDSDTEYSVLIVHFALLNAGGEVEGGVNGSVMPFGAGADIQVNSDSIYARAILDAVSVECTTSLQD